jgi:hypothetical protein
MGNLFQKQIGTPGSAAAKVYKTRRIKTPAPAWKWVTWSGIKTSWK